jgi:hypothetical protein
MLARTLRFPFLVLSNQVGAGARSGWNACAIIGALSLLTLTSPRAAIASAWLTLSTSHYEIHTDLDPALATELALRMDAMYDEYARRFAAVPHPLRPKLLHAYLFRWRADYLDLVGPAYRNTAGLFMPSRNLLAAFLEGQGPEALRRTLQHEAFHQFAYVALGPDLPPWLNEGLAQLFEESRWNGDRFEMYQVPARRARQVEADLRAGRWLDVRDLIALTPDDWSDAFTGSPALGRARYAEAWALVYFLAHERDPAGNPYLPRLLNLLARIHQGDEPTGAFVDLFPDLAASDLPFTRFIWTLRHERR